MEEKDMTLERFKETGVVTLKFEEKNEKENEEC